MKKINFYTSRGQRYGKIPATSYRENGKVKKRNDGIYLGRVIDEEKCVFFSAERGLFTYDIETDSYLPADEKYVSSLPDDQRKRPRICLDFGNAYLVHELLRSCGFNQVIDSFSYRTKTRCMR